MLLSSGVGTESVPRPASAIKAANCPRRLRSVRIVAALGSVRSWL